MARSFLYVLLFLITNIANCQDFFDPDNFAASCTSENRYTWEDYSFYQILSLEPQPPDDEPTSKTQSKKLESRTKRRKRRLAIKSTDIRKAYRKQAQLFHPDKLVKRKNSTDMGSSKTSQLSKEESTARFQMIAEAYQVLSDTGKREEYDQFLLDCEDYKQQQQQHDSPKQSDNTRRRRKVNPYEVFEEFFFGTSSSTDDYNDSDYGRQGRRSAKDYTSPRKVYEREEINFDPYHRVEILRTYRTEEYDTEHDKTYYVRTIAQDFVRQYDPFYGYEKYSPITQPFVVEEGYRDDGGFDGYDERDYQQDKGHKSSSSQSKDSYYSSSLLPGEFLTPTSTVLTSSNGKYYAGLTPECDFVIISDLGTDIEDNVVWSSETYIPPTHLSNGGCFVTLQGPFLVLVLGSPEHRGKVLWSSEVSSTDKSDSGQSEPEYFARLDDDGSLAVYSQTIIPIKDGDNDNKSNGWWARTMKQTSNYPPRTRAAKAWVHVRQWANNKLSGQKRTHYYSSDQDDNNTKCERCIFATGPAGCNTPARRLLHLTQYMKHGMQSTMTKLDNAIDSFVETLSEGQEDDIDILDTLQRVLGRAGTRIGSGIGHAMKKVRNKIQDHLDR